MHAGGDWPQPPATSKSPRQHQQEHPLQGCLLILAASKLTVTGTFTLQRAVETRLRAD